jgi:hypothetical protein
MGQKIYEAGELSH